MDAEERTAWLEERRKGIGGSDIASICGLSKWKTAYDVWNDKLGQAEEQPETEYQYWGHVLEDVVAKEYQRRSGNRVQRVNKMMTHPDHAFMMANIDRAVVNTDIAGNVRWDGNKLTTDRILECKTSNAFTARLWGDAETDEVPDYYLVQVQWYLGVTGCRYGDLSVLIGGNDYRQFTMERDDDLIADLMQEADLFWRRVQEGIAPDPQTLEDAKAIWAQHVKDKHLIVDVEGASVIGRLAQLAEERKVIQEEENALKLKLFSAIQDAEDVVFEHGGDKLASWKTQSSTRLDSKSLKAEHPDLFDAYSKTSSTRVLRLTNAGKELAHG